MNIKLLFILGSLSFGLGSCMNTQKNQADETQATDSLSNKQSDIQSQTVIADSAPLQDSDALCYKEEQGTLITENSLECARFEKYKVKILPAQREKDFFALEINDIVYPVSEILDYGELDIKLFKQGDNALLLIGGLDFYGSYYHIYKLNQTQPIYLGMISGEPKDPETNGRKKERLEICLIEDKLDVRFYFGDEYAAHETFPIS